MVDFYIQRLLKINLIIYWKLGQWKHYSFIKITVIQLERFKEMLNEYNYTW
jgi:hypothetical protein